MTAEMILWPLIEGLMPDYPEVKIKVGVESRFTDIVAERFDAGVRLGESLDRDRIAVRIGPDMTMALVASPDHLARHPSPTGPQDLVHPTCINLRLPTSGNLYAWEFVKNGRPLTMRVKGPLTCKVPGLCLNAARAGLGLAFVPEPYVTEDLACSRLIRLLQDWCPVFPGFHLYFPNRCQTSPAMALVVQTLRWRGATAAG